MTNESNDKKLPAALSQLPASSSPLSRQVEQIAGFPGGILDAGFGRHVGLGHFVAGLVRFLPEASAIGVPVFGFMVFAVGLANSGGVFRLLIAQDLPLLGRGILP